MKKFYLAILTIIGVMFPLKALAVCPVCTIAVGAGVGLSRYLGIDDTITGVWVGGLTVSLIMWTINWMEKKRWYFQARNLIITTVYFLFIVVPLYISDIIGHPLNRLWGIDKLLLGMIIGSIVFWISVNIYESMKKKNNGHAYFPYQKIVMPVFLLSVASGLFYLIIKK